jgi:hypothetical protein
MRRPNVVNHPHDLVLHSFTYLGSWGTVKVNKDKLVPQLVYILVRWHTSAVFSPPGWHHFCPASLQPEYHHFCFHSEYLTYLSTSIGHMATVKLYKHPYLLECCLRGKCNNCSCCLSFVSRHLVNVNETLVAVFVWFTNQDPCYKTFQAHNLWILGIS